MKRLLLGVLIGLLSTGGGAARAGLVVAEDLLVNLDARGLALGPALDWVNEGSLGGVFAVNGNPQVQDVSDGVLTATAVTFDGAGDWFVGPNAPLGIEDEGTRSIEAWVYNPAVAAEEMIVSWSHRGTNARNNSYGYGSDDAYGAAGHWGGANDIGWNNPHPADGQWHHLAWTYDGTMMRVYADGVELNSKDLGDTLDSFNGLSINIGAQRNNAGDAVGDLPVSLSTAQIRIHDGVLSADDVLFNYNAGITADITAAELSSLLTGNWNDNATPVWSTTDPTITIPTDNTAVVVNDGHTVTIQTGAAAGLAHSLEILGTGKVVVGANQSLAVSTRVDGSNVELGDGAVLSARYGSIDSLVATAGNATIDVGTNLPVGLLGDGGVAGTLVKTGAGTLILDNSAGNGMSAVADTIFRVEAGTLQSQGADPLDQATRLQLAGGAFRLLGAATDASSVDVALSADSALKLDTGGDVTFGTLTLKNGILTTTGTSSGVTFGSTAIDPAATRVGVNPEIETDFGVDPLDATGTALEVFSKGGSGKLILGAPDSTLAFAPAGMTGVAIDAHQGELVMIGSEAWGGSTAMLLSGGVMTIASGPGPLDNGGPGLLGEFYGSDVDMADVVAYSGGWISPILAGAGGTSFEAFTVDAQGISPTLNYPAGDVDASDGDIFGNLFDPAADTYSDDFAVRWTGKILMPDEGDYKFTLATNAGGKLWIDGQQVASYAQSANQFVPATGTFTVAAGEEGQHDIVVGYSDIALESGIELTWDYGNLGDGIDPQYLSREPTPGASESLAMTGHTVEVIADSTLNAMGPTADFGPLTLTAGTLTTAGAPGGMSFTSTTVSGTAGVHAQTATTLGDVTINEGAVLTTAGTGPIVFPTGIAFVPGINSAGVDLQVATELGTIDATGTADGFVFSMRGPAGLTIGPDTATKFQGMTGAVLDAGGGPLTLIGNAAWAGANQARLSGGTFIVTDVALPIPAMPPGIAFWLDADDPTTLSTTADGTGPAPADGQGVAYWADKDGSGNVATAPAGMPQFVADGVNGKPVLRFVAAESDSLDYADVAAQDTTTFIMYKMNAGSGWRNPMDATSTTQGWLHMTRDQERSLQKGGGDQNLFSGVSAHEWHLQSFQLKTQDYRLWVDGVMFGPNTTSTQTFDPFTQLGGFTSLDMDVAEVLVYTGTLSDAEHVAVGTYFADKYGLSTSYRMPIPALTLTDKHFTVAADSTLFADTDFSADFGNLRLENGVMSVTGAPDGVTFLSTTVETAAPDDVTGINAQMDFFGGPLTIASGVLETAGQPIEFSSTTIPNGATTVGFKVEGPLELGVITGEGDPGAGPAVVISKSGSLELALAQPNVGLENATFDAREGVLRMVGIDAWGGSTEGRISGGTLSIDVLGAGGDPLLPVDLLDTNITVVGGGTLGAAMSGLNLNVLNIGDGETLTTTGSPITFSSVNFEGDGDATVGIHSNTDTTLTEASGLDGGGRNLTIAISGSGRTILTRPGTNLENTTFRLDSGELVGLLDPGGAFGSVAFNGGGLLVSSTGGNLTFDNPLSVTGDGTFATTAELPGGVGNVEVALNAVTFDNHAVLSLEANDGYTFNLNGPMSGKGGVEFLGGNVNLQANAPMEYQGKTVVRGGTVVVDAPIDATTGLEVLGGKMVINSDVIVNISDLLGTLVMSGFMDPANPTNSALMDFSNGGGLMAMVPVGTTQFRGNFDISGDGTFRGLIPGITVNDLYQTLFTGMFNATVSGDYRLEFQNRDDRVVMYLDLDRDGVFQSTERMLGDNGVKTQYLDAGEYAVAFGHMEGTGGSRIRFLMQTPPDGPIPTNSVVNLGNAAHAELFIQPDAIPAATTVDNGELEVNGMLDGGNLTVTNSSLKIGPDGLVLADKVTFDGNSTADVEGSLVIAASLSYRVDTVVFPTFTVGDGQATFMGADLTKNGPERITLNGTLAMATTTGAEGDGLMGSIFRGTPRNDTRMNLIGAAYYPSATRIFTGDKANTVLAVAEDGANNLLLSGTTQAWNSFPNFDGNADDFITAYSGRFYPPETGDYRFRFDCDDRAWMFIDMDDNGTFDDTVDQVGNYEWTSNGIKTLEAGRGYSFVAMGQEYAGNQTFNWYFTPPGGAEKRVDLSDPAQEGLWRTITPSAAPISMPNTDIVVESDSAIDLGGLAGQFRNLTVEGDSELLLGPFDPGVGNVSTYTFADVTADDGTAVYGELEISGNLSLAGDAPLWSATAGVNPTIRHGLLDQHIGTLTFVGHPQMVVEEDAQGNVLSTPRTTFEIFSDQSDKIVLTGTPTIDSEMTLDGDVTLRGIGVLWNGSVPQGHIASTDPGNVPPEPLTLTFVEVQDTSSNTLSGMFDVPEAFAGHHIGSGIFNMDVHPVLPTTQEVYDQAVPGELLWLELGQVDLLGQPIPEEAWGWRYYPVDPGDPNSGFLPKVTDANGLTYHLVDDGVISYGDLGSIPRLAEDEAFSKVTGDLFIARSGDADGDGAVNGLDVAAMIGNWTGNRWKPTPNKTWLDGDVAGGPSDRGDGQVNLRDFMALLQNYSKADPGVAEGSATAVYDPATGRFTVSVDGVMAWALSVDGQLTGEDVQGVAAALSSGEGTLVSANGDVVGAGSLVGLLSYADVELGQLVEPGTDPSAITFEYMLGFGSPRHSGTITVVPEPGTVVLLLSGLLALLLLIRRRR
ncbi:MAG TPA: PA14 domain-containing protein [Thermoguttaceae bacterium]|nr:PA14 domain-containing protein [Thermoguttaceae bacterium]